MNRTEQEIFAAYTRWEEAQECGTTLNLLKAFYAGYEARGVEGWEWMIGIGDNSPFYSSESRAMLAEIIRRQARMIEVLRAGLTPIADFSSPFMSDFHNDATRAQNSLSQAKRIESGDAPEKHK